MIELSINWGDVARFVLLSRELDLFEEKHLAPQGKVKYQFSAKGHELSQVLLAQALDHSHDGFHSIWCGQHQRKNRRTAGKISLT